MRSGAVGIVVPHNQANGLDVLLWAKGQHISGVRYLKLPMGVGVLILANPEREETPESYAEAVVR